MLNITYIEMNDYNGYYLIGDNGTISNRVKELKTFINNSGYVCIKLTNGGKKRHCLIHRLVAEHHIKNPDNKREVNHINGDKLNNNAYNLEWVTSSENKLHALRTGLKVYNNPTKGIKISNTSKYHNVGYDNSRGKWKAAVRLNGKTYFQKRFNTEEEAALHVNWILDELKLFDRPQNVICN